jgi:hypothetical protein
MSTDKSPGPSGLHGSTGAFRRVRISVGGDLLRKIEDREVDLEPTLRQPVDPTSTFLTFSMTSASRPPASGGIE